MILPYLLVTIYQLGQGCRNCINKDAAYDIQ